MPLTYVVRGALERLLATRGYSLVRTWRLRDLREATAQLRLAEHLAKLFAQAAPECVLDVGANRGQYRDLLRDEVGYGGPIVSYEPVPELANALRERARQDAAWQVEATALGSAEGALDLKVAAASEFSSFLQPSASRPSQFADFGTTVGIVRVPVRTLAGEVARLRHRHGYRRYYLKLDTQGFDLEVFRGAGDALGAVVAMQSEVAVLPLYEGMPDWLDAIREFEAKGFEVTGMFPVALDRATLRVVEFDCVLVRPDLAGKPGA